MNSVLLNPNNINTLNETVSNTPYFVPQVSMSGHILSYRYVMPEMPTLFKSFQTKVMPQSKIEESIMSFEHRTKQQGGEIHFIKMFSSNDPYFDMIWDKLVEDRELHWANKLTALRTSVNDLRSKVLFETEKHQEFRKERAERWAAANADSTLLAQINLKI
jgi:hypothetical protein